MKKTKILFVASSLLPGGAEKALINLLTAMDPNRYDIDLLLLRRIGLYLDILPSHVRLLPSPEEYAAVISSYSHLLKNAARGKQIPILFNRMGTAIRLRTSPRLSAGRRVQITSSRNVKVLPSLPGHYDVAVGFQHGAAAYYVAEKVSADRKIGWVHNNLKELGFLAEKELHYYRKLDRIVALSDQNKEMLQNMFPSLSDRIVVLYNLVFKDLLHQLAGSHPPEEYERFDGKKLLTIGRFTPQKNYPLSIDACAILKERGHRLRWYVIGQGELRPDMEHQIREKGLEEDFILLGIRQNPYPYFRFADIYVQSSLYEGYSTTLTESRLLQLPPVATNFPYVEEQITPGETGLISEMNAESLADQIERLLTDPALAGRIRDNLAGTEDSRSELSKYDALFEGRG